MGCKVLNINTAVAEKFPSIQPLILDNTIYAIDYGYRVEVSVSWLVDLTSTQQKEFDALSIELNKK
jgi:hypothetical protein